MSRPNQSGIAHPHAFVSMCMFIGVAISLVGALAGGALFGWFFGHPIMGMQIMAVVFTLNTILSFPQFSVKYDEYIERVTNMH